jgi:hypothetical protein
MPRSVFKAAIVLGSVVLPLAATAGPLDELKSPKLDVPASDMMFPDGPGADTMNNNCLSCHSADHVLNQPNLPREVWEEVVHKMIDGYKAPVSPQDAEQIVDYLTRTKGLK